MPQGVPTDPWRVAEVDFPYLGSPAAQLHFLLHYAVLAPSSHNSQPWQFRIGGNQVELRADTSRALSVVDPDCRELVISCGAALEHLLVAMAHFRFAGEVSLFPDPADPNLLAVACLGEAGLAADPIADTLFRAIPHRHTHREPFFDQIVLDATLDQLRAAAAVHGAWLQAIHPGDTRQAVTMLVAEADEVQMNDPCYRRELADWLRSNHAAAADGIPGYALGVSDLKSSWSALAVRFFDLGRATAARDRQLARQAPVLAVLGTIEDSPRHWLAAGQALARVLLTARVQNIHAAFLNQPIEVPHFRARLAELIHHNGFPQLMLRLGYGAETRPTPRRPVRDTLAA